MLTRSLIVACAMALLAGLCYGISIPVTQITILPSSSPAYAGVSSSVSVPPGGIVGAETVVNSATQYLHQYALDRDEDRYISDFAGWKTGIGTRLDFKLAQPYWLTEVIFTDRQTSGSSNHDPFLGPYDFVTSYRYVLSQDSTFGNVDDVVITVSGRTVPSLGDKVLAHWQTTSTFSSPILAQYIRWEVLGTNGINPGMADIDFHGSVVPEPATYALMGTVGLALYLLRRRKAASKG